MRRTMRYFPSITSPVERDIWPLFYTNERPVGFSVTRRFVRRPCPGGWVAPRHTGMTHRACRGLPNIERRADGEVERERIVADPVLRRTGGVIPGARGPTSARKAQGRGRHHRARPARGA